jgi:hypothetical protein
VTERLKLSSTAIAVDRPQQLSFGQKEIHNWLLVLFDRSLQSPSIVHWSCRSVEKRLKIGCWCCCIVHCIRRRLFTVDAVRSFEAGKILYWLLVLFDRPVQSHSKLVVGVVGSFTAIAVDCKLWLPFGRSKHEKFKNGIWCCSIVQCNRRRSFTAVVVRSRRKSKLVWSFGRFL